MNDSRKGILKNSINAALGLMFFGFGVYLTIQANIGVAAWDVLTIALSEKLHVLYGTVFIGLSVTIIVIDLLLGEKLGIGTILDAIVVGKTVDLLNWLNLVPKLTNVRIAILVFFIGMFIEGYTQYLYMKSALCCGPRDTLCIGINRRLPKLKIGAVTFIVQAIVVIIGIVLGGPFGVGTIIAPFGIGLCQQLAFNMVHFDPKDVEHQGILQSLKIIVGKQKNV